MEDHVSSQCPVATTYVVKEAPDETVSTCSRPRMAVSS